MSRLTVTVAGVGSNHFECDPSPVDPMQAQRNAGVASIIPCSQTPRQECRKKIANTTPPMARATAKMTANSIASRSVRLAMS